MVEQVSIAKLCSRVRSNPGAVLASMSGPVSLAMPTDEDPGPSSPVTTQHGRVPRRKKSEAIYNGFAVLNLYFFPLLATQASSLISRLHNALCQPEPKTNSFSHTNDAFLDHLVRHPFGIGFD